MFFLLTGTLSAQAPPGLLTRLDRSTSATDPDDVPDVTIVSADRGFQVTTGPATVAWDPANTATGSYNLKATFTLLEPSSHTNYYGLVFGGSELEGPSQNYIYFLVAQNGAFLIKRREGDVNTRDVIASTPHSAIVRPDAAGTSVNALEVRVGSDQIAYLVNGTQVHTTPKTGVTATTDGIWGVRVNHVIPGVLVEGLGVTR
jgi:hypothetical protein